MNIVIVGDGKVGFALAHQLSNEGHDIVVIDSDKSLLQTAQESLDVNAVHGNGATLKIQKLAGVDNSELLIAATSADETNLLCCVVAKSLGCRHTVARVRNPEYYHQIDLLKDTFGINMMINPERSTANEIFRLLQFPSFLKRDSFARGRAEIVELVIKEDSPIAGKYLYELDQILKLNILICAVVRQSEVIIPNGNLQLLPADKISITASRSDLARLLRNLELDSKKVRDVLIIGGSRIAQYLADDLISSSVDVKILEISEQQCNHLAENLPKAEIIFSDGTNKATLDAEGIEKADAVVTLTDYDEENLMVSMYANFLNVQRVITKVNRTEYNEVLRNKGIECLISPKDLCCVDIVHYVRTLDNSKNASAITLHRMIDNKVEALEFLVDSNTPHLGKQFFELRFKKNLLVACINRRGKIIIPKGKDKMERGDTVIIVSLAEQMIQTLSDIFLS